MEQWLLAGLIIRAGRFDSDPRYMKVIFLDVDGVLNSNGERGVRRGTNGLDPVLVRRYLNLAAATNAFTVISSTWRLSADTREMLEAAGIHSIGSTPDFRSYSERAEEIEEWLRLHPKVTAYAILDDDAMMLPHQPFFHCDYREGLTDEVVWRVIQHFAV